jgi:exosortase
LVRDKRNVLSAGEADDQMRRVLSPNPDQSTPSSPSPQGFRVELRQVFRELPDKPLLGVLLVVWIGLFHLLGVSTLGYARTSSIFGWWYYVMTRGVKGNPLTVLDQEEAHAWVMPLVVLGLLWWQRERLVGVAKRIWWPAFALLVGALLLHFAAFFVQQPRFSLLAFFLGVYAFIGIVWGPGWLRLAFFPFALLVFCVPLGGAAEIITVPLRGWAAQITVGVAHTVLGLANVIRVGNTIMDADGRYQYEVAAACSGLRSLTAITALALIAGIVTFHTNWRRLVMVLAAVPLAVMGNVLRLLLIILAAEAFNQEAGNAVHASFVFSLVPYVPAFVGVLALAHWLREDRAAKPAEGKT